MRNAKVPSYPIEAAKKIWLLSCTSVRDMHVHVTDIGTEDDNRYLFFSALSTCLLESESLRVMVTHSLFQQHAKYITAWRLVCDLNSAMNT